MATPANYVLIKEVTLNANATSIVLASIPSGYTDLVLKISGRLTSNDNYYSIKFNNVSTTVSVRTLRGNGSGADSENWSGNYIAISEPNNYTANTFANTEFYFPNYAGSSNKSFSVDSVNENNATGAFVQMAAGLWANTAAITQIEIGNITGASGLLAGTTFSVYGVASLNATPTVVPFASGGDIVTNDGTYWYHAFLASGTFIPNKNLTCDYLVVAGGGGSSSFNAQSGGGAGGLRYAMSQSLPATPYTVSIGAGGAGGVGTAAYVTGSNGGNSSFNSLTSTGGGGGSGSTYTAGSGGSGGGSWNQGTAGAGNTPSVSPAQGYAGAKGTTDGATYTNGGAGGGAGGAASAAVSNTRAGNGGIGYYDSFTNAIGAATGTGVLNSSNYYYAGGGGGYAQAGTQGTGGTGGGGAGGGANTGVINTGGGGGSNNGSINGNAGGSGIVIIRYAM